MSEEINKNFKGLYDTSKTTFITDRTEPAHFYEPEVKTPRIKNVLYSINFDKKELYKQIDDLQQKVEQLEKELQIAANKCKQLENIRKEAIEECKSVIGNPEHTIVSKNELMKIMLNILNKGDNKE